MLIHTFFKSHTKLTIITSIFIPKRGVKKLIEKSATCIGKACESFVATAQNVNPQANNAAADLQKNPPNPGLLTTDITQEAPATVPTPTINCAVPETTVHEMLRTLTPAVKYGPESLESRSSSSNSNSEETPPRSSSTDTKSPEVNNQLPMGTAATHNSWTSENKTGVDFSKPEVQNMKKTVMNYGTSSNGSDKSVNNDPCTTDNDNKVASSESSFEQATNSNAILTEKVFRIHTPLGEEIGTTSTSIEEHTHEIDQLLQNAVGKGLLEYADAPDGNKEFGSVSLTREGNVLYKEIDPDKKELNSNPMKLPKESFQAGTVVIDDSTLITRPDQEHVVVAVVGEKLIGVGYLTSKAFGPVNIANEQPSGDKKPDGTPKAQNMSVFKEPQEISKEDFEVDHIVTDFIQNTPVAKAIQDAVAPILGLAPVPYNPVGITEEQLQVIIALKEIKDAEEAIKKEAKPKNFLTEEQDKKQTLKKEKAEKNKLKQKEAHEKMKKATIQNDANTN
jgi:hypothetical protein